MHKGSLAHYIDAFNVYLLFMQPVIIIASAVFYNYLFFTVQIFGNTNSFIIHIFKTVIHILINIL